MSYQLDPDAEAFMAFPFRERSFEDGKAHLQKFGISRTSKPSLVQVLSLLAGSAFYTNHELYRWLDSEHTITVAEFRESETFAWAMEANKVDFVRWLIQRFGKENCNITKGFLNAVVSNSLDVLHFLDNEFVLTADMLRARLDCFASPIILGELDTVKWVVNRFDMTADDFRQWLKTGDSYSFGRTIGKHPETGKWLVNKWNLTDPEILRGVNEAH